MSVVFNNHLFMEEYKLWVVDTFYGLTAPGKDWRVYPRTAADCCHVRVTYIGTEKNPWEFDITFLADCGSKQVAAEVEKFILAKHRMGEVTLPGRFTVDWRGRNIVYETNSRGYSVLFGKDYWNISNNEPLFLLDEMDKLHILASTPNNKTSTVLMWMLNNNFRVSGGINKFGLEEKPLPTPFGMHLALDIWHVMQVLPIPVYWVSTYQLENRFNFTVQNTPPEVEKVTYGKLLEFAEVCI